MAAQFEDVTVNWGQPRGQADIAFQQWWHAIYQDMVPSHDGSKLYFLFDQSVGGGQGYHQCIMVFDPHLKRFVGEIPLYINEGRVKYFYLVRPNELALFVQAEEHGGDCILWMFSLLLNPDGMSIGQQRSVVQSLNVGADWIIAQAQDTVILVSGPGLTVWRLCTQRGVLYTYVVPGGNIKNYFDATVFGGVIYLFPALPDENLDFTHVHTIDTEGRTPMRPFPTKQDPQNGFPGVRKQCALDIYQGKLYVIGGHLEDRHRGTYRYGDVWALDLRSLQWERQQSQLPLLIVEPRLHMNEQTGVSFVWGDCEMQRGCYTNKRHFHVMRSYFAGAPPPAYNAAPAQSPPAYGMTA